MIRIGILGAAAIAPSAMIEPAAKRKDCMITAVACRDLDRGKSFADKHGIPFAVSDYQALIDRNDIDLVYNALPPSRHADLSIAALENGKHVLCEKPFAMNAAEAATIAEASDRTGLACIEAFHYRFHPAFARFLNIIEQGEIGDILRLHANFSTPIPFKTGEIRHILTMGGGALMDLGCYPIHWVRMVMGHEPSVRSATCATGQPHIDITTTAELAFEDGVSASIECSMAINQSFTAELTVWGTKGRVHFDNPLSPHTGHLISTTINGKIRAERVPAGSTYDHQLEHALAVANVEAPAIGGGDDAVANMAVIDGIYRSAGLNPR